jgi:ABC-type transport system substrate-binding protein
LTKEANGNIKNYVLESYEQYHLGQAYIEELTLKFYPDFEVAAAALQNKMLMALSIYQKATKIVSKTKKSLSKNYTPLNTLLSF